MKKSLRTSPGLNWAPFHFPVSRHVTGAGGKKSDGAADLFLVEPRRCLCFCTDMTLFADMLTVELVLLIVQFLDLESRCMPRACLACLHRPGHPGVAAIYRQGVVHRVLCSPGCQL